MCHVTFRKVNLGKHTSLSLATCCNAKGKCVTWHLGKWIWETYFIVSGYVLQCEGKMCHVTFRKVNLGNILHCLWLRAGRSGDRFPVWARFSTPIQTGPGAHPASCAIGTGYFPGVTSGRGVTLTPHPLLVPWSWKSRAIPLLPLWAVRPVQTLSACTRVTLTLILLNCQHSYVSDAAGSTPTLRTRKSVFKSEPDKRYFDISVAWQNGCRQIIVLPLIRQRLLPSPSFRITSVTNLLPFFTVQPL